MRRIYSARRRRRAFDPCVGFRPRHAYTGRIFVVVVINTHLSVSMRAWDRCSLAVSRTYIHTYTYVYVASQLASCRPRPSMLQWRLLPSLLPNHCSNISSLQHSVCNLADCLVGVGAAEKVWIDRWQGEIHMLAHACIMFYTLAIIASSRSNRSTFSGVVYVLNFDGSAMHEKMSLISRFWRKIAFAVYSSTNNNNVVESSKNVWFTANCTIICLRLVASNGRTNFRQKKLGKVW